MTIAPIRRRTGEGWFIITREAFGDACPEYGPYATRAEAEEDRADVIRIVKTNRLAGIKQIDKTYAIQPTELFEIIGRLAKYTRGSMQIDRLRPAQVTELGNLALKWKAGTDAPQIKVTRRVLRMILYRESLVHPDWPDADDCFIHWAKQLKARASQCLNLSRPDMG